MSTLMLLPVERILFARDGGDPTELVDLPADMARSLYPDIFVIPELAHGNFNKVTDPKVNEFLADILTGFRQGPGAPGSDTVFQAFQNEKDGKEFLAYLNATDEALSKHRKGLQTKAKKQFREAHYLSNEIATDIMHSLSANSSFKEMRLVDTTKTLDDQWARMRYTLNAVLFILMVKNRVPLTSPVLASTAILLPKTKRYQKETHARVQALAGAAA